MIPVLRFCRQVAVVMRDRWVAMVFAVFVAACGGGRSDGSGAGADSATGELPVEAGQVQAMAVEGERVAVALGDGGLLPVDAALPTRPRVLGRIRDGLRAADAEAFDEVFGVAWLGPERLAALVRPACLGTCQADFAGGELRYFHLDGTTGLVRDATGPAGGVPILARIGDRLFGAAAQVGFGESASFAVLREFAVDGPAATAWSDSLALPAQGLLAADGAGRLVHVFADPQTGDWHAQRIRIDGDAGPAVDLVYRDPLPSPGELSAAGDGMLMRSSTGQVALLRPESGGGGMVLHYPLGAGFEAAAVAAAGSRVLLAPSGGGVELRALSGDAISAPEGRWSLDGMVSRLALSPQLAVAAHGAPARLAFLPLAPAAP